MKDKAFHLLLIVKEQTSAGLKTIVCMLVQIFSMIRKTNLGMDTQVPILKQGILISFHNFKTFKIVLVT